MTQSHFGDLCAHKVMPSLLKANFSIKPNSFYCNSTNNHYIVIFEKAKISRVYSNLPSKLVLCFFFLEQTSPPKNSLCCRACCRAEVSLCDCSEADLNEHVCSWGAWAQETHAVNTDAKWKRAMKEANLLFISGITPWGKAPSHSNAL